MILNFKCKCGADLETAYQIITPGCNDPSVVVTPCHLCMADRKLLLDQMQDLMVYQNKVEEIYKILEVEEP